ncbi:hypothetical protein [Constantimarinum furrinae]|uniref:Uncharacterized protein n=1 Tax=Constantimarinum furrinae TaxID=2562285 RepID=A0A7G8PUZ1_9FLAO|nr:hypothetical protein [Constantimarinum furrinae]QNJ98152.1 hypothetical protein ALE3EI_1595 [Constantimarinum furrinae]QNJ98157.1 hypothetical protein ALE3EI_1600 [Constantimarinum furrinae]
MAINQFLTFVLPKKPIEEKYGGIPKQLEIKLAEWEKYWENYDMELNDEPEPEFKDAISTKWWKGIEIDIVELRKDIDKIITRAEWNGGTSWKTGKAEFDHDLSIDFNDKENYIEDFRFRTDLTDSTLIFIKSMLDLCEKNEWILMDDKGNLCEPKIQNLVELIKESRAHLFITNPDQFYDTLK